MNNINFNINDIIFYTTISEINSNISFDIMITIKRNSKCDNWLLLKTKDEMVEIINKVKIVGGSNRFVPYFFTMDICYE